MTTTTERRRHVVAAVVLAALAAGTTACTPTVPDDERIEIHASFAPLAYLAERIAGDRASVVDLTPAGADPHSHELSPATTAALADADLVLLVSGLQPAIDAAVAAAEPAHVVDTLSAATVDLAADDGPVPEPTRDPHFWLDPLRFAFAAGQVAEALATIDPDHAAEYGSRAGELDADLEELDLEYREALDPCAGATLVTGHEAFGYLAARYDLEQIGITGIDPEVEPSPARLRDVRDVVLDRGVTTLFFDTAAAPVVAEQLASDLGVETAVLDPMERPNDPDYLSAMRANLLALTAGLVCGG